MKKLFKTMTAMAVTGTMAMSMGIGMTSFADDTPATPTTTPSRNTYSQFTNGGTDANSDIDKFYLIKDYDSKNPTRTAPESKSPAETFTYKITPYAVWNAGSTYVNGTATKITVANMPMLGATGITLSGEYENRTLTLTQGVVVSDAKYEETNDRDETPDTNKATVTLPTYNTVGDYWYKVEETLGNTTGVIYGTNSLTADNSTDATQNLGHNRTYYIHVQVTETSATAGKPTLVRNVTMHQSAPDTSLKNDDYNDETNTSKYYITSNKVNAIENTYYAGDLVIKKEVTGNAGDKSEYFKVTVKFTKPLGTVVNSDITYEAFIKSTDTSSGKSVDTYTKTKCTINGQYSPSLNNDNTSKESDSNRYWNKTTGLTDEATVTCTFYVKDNDTVTFSNIPYGINYEIVEEKPADDTYQNVIKFKESDGTAKFDGESLQPDTDSDNEIGDNFNKSAKGSISDIRDEVTITNKKTSTIDIGVILSNAPFVAMLGMAVTAMFVLFRQRRNRKLED